MQKDECVDCCESSKEEKDSSVSPLPKLSIDFQVLDTAQKQRQRSRRNSLADVISDWPALQTPKMYQKVVLGRIFHRS